MSPSESKTPLDWLIRISVGSIVSTMLIFLLNNYLNFWQKWPGLITFLAHRGWFGLTPLDVPLGLVQIVQGWLQLCSYLGGGILALSYVIFTREHSLRTDAARLSAFAAYIIRAAFWAVLTIGIVDLGISLLRVENLLEPLIGKELALALGRSQFRGVYVHYPLIMISLIIAFFIRSLGFVWLSLLIVFAEFQIVIFRFIFSYEQAFMGDLVRFWYAALFLFASPYTLLFEGHVRVDVLYTHFKRRTKAWSNTVGLLFFGLPLCWVILITGMWDKSSSINSPLRNFEVSQAGYGMYVKYLMVGFLAIFTISMIVQFSSYLLENVAELRDKATEEKPTREH